MKERQPSITIGGVEVQPGQRKTFDLPVAKLYTHTDIKIPVHVIHGKRPGPRLFVCAAIHGDEILGVEIIRRLLKRKGLSSLSGTMIAIPIVNVFGFINHSRYSPDRRDLNRFFPGTGTGSLTSRMAYLFMQEIVSHCTHGIDLHAGSYHRENLPQVRVQLENPEAERLARAFGAPVILDADEREGTLRQAAREHGIQLLLYEAGEVLRFDEVAIRTGIRGIVSVMREIGMQRDTPRKQPRVKPVIARSSTWVRAPISGILRTQIGLGDHVKMKSPLGVIADPFGDTEETVASTASGIVIGRLNMPLVHKGDAVFHIARFASSTKASETIEVFRQEFEKEA